MCCLRTFRMRQTRENAPAFVWHKPSNPSTSRCIDQVRSTCPRNIHLPLCQTFLSQGSKQLAFWRLVPPSTWNRWYLSMAPAPLQGSSQGPQRAVSRSAPGRYPSRSSWRAASCPAHIWHVTKLRMLWRRMVSTCNIPRIPSLREHKPQQNS